MSDSSTTRQRNGDSTAEEGTTSGQFGRLVRAHPVVAFFAIAFAYSWGVFALMYGAMGSEQVADSRAWQVPFAWGPPLAALLVTWLNDGDVGAWLRAVADPRTNPRWYLLAALVAFLYADAGTVLAALIGIPVSMVPLEELAVSFGVTLLVAGSLEEFGWRGFAQPRLQARHDALVAAIVVGITVGVWHYPWLLLAGAGYERAGVGALVALPLLMVLMAAIFAWLFNSSGGAVPVVMLGHAVFNATPVFELTGGGPGWLGAIGLLLWVGLVVLLVVVHGRAFLAPSGPPQLVLGNEE